MNALDEKHADPINEMSRIAKNILKLDALAFKETYRSLSPGELIYNSEWCRISLGWNGWDPSDGNSISIHYGRLHAPNEQSTMMWGQELCHCWHRLNYVLHFLDNRTPSEAAVLSYSHFLTDPFYEESFIEDYRRKQPEWLAEMHVTVWKHYNMRLFELFDLRQSDLWNRYRRFLKEVYDIKGRSLSIQPPLDKVC